MAGGRGGEWRRGDAATRSDADLSRHTSKKMGTRTALNEVATRKCPTWQCRVPFSFRRSAAAAGFSTGAPLFLKGTAATGLKERENGPARALTNGVPLSGPRKSPRKCTVKI